MRRSEFAFNTELFDSLCHGIFILDKDFKIINLNTNAAAMLSGSKSSIIGKNFAESLSVKMDRAILKNILGEVLKTHKPKTLKHFGVVLNNKLLHLNNHISYVNAPNFKGLIIESYDISKEFELEQGLVKSEEKYRNLIENTNDVVFCLDLNGNFTFLNAPAELVSGYKKEELIGRPFSAVIAPASLKKATYYNKCRIEGKITPSRYEIEAITKRGRVVPFELNITEIKQDGKIIGVLGVARDISERHELQKNLKQRNIQLSFLYTTGLSLQATIDLDTITTVALDTFLKLGFDRVGLFLYNETENAFVGRKCTYLPDEEFQGIKIKLTAKHTKQMKNAGKPLVFRKGTALFKNLAGNNLNESAALPLLSKNQVLGFISVDNKYSKEPLNEENLSFLMTFANQVALSVERSYLYKNDKQRLEILTALHDISWTISSTLDLDKVLQLMVNKIAKLIPAHYCSIFLLNKDEQSLVVRCLYKLHKKYLKKDPIISAKEGIMGLAIQTKQIQTCLDATTDPRFVYVNFARRNAIKSALCVPLLVRSEPIGVINIYLKHEHHFTDNEVNLMRSLASQAALAIENAKLYEKDKRRLNRLSALYEIGRAISSTLDLEKVLNLIVIKIVKLLRVKICSVLLLNKSKTNFTIKSVYNLSGDYFNKGRICLDKSISGLAVNTKQVQYSKNVQSDSRFQFKAFARKEGLRSFLSVPLIVRSEAIGVINIYTKSEREFTEGEIGLLQGLVNQAALAIENAKLYQKVKHDKQNLSKLLEISQIINSTLQFEDLLKNLLNQTMELTGTVMGNISILNGDILTIKYFKGKDSESLKDLTIPKNQGLIGWVATNKKPLFVDDVTKDLRYYNFRENIRSEAVIPLMVQDKLIGVLDLESDNLGNYKRLANTLTILGNHIAIALENSLLYDKITQFNETLKEEITLATKELEEKNKKLLELDLMKSEFVSTVSHELKTPLTSIKGYIALLLAEKIKSKDNQIKALKIINEESDRLANLINDVLDLSKLESGKTKFKPETFNIGLVIKEVNNSMISLAIQKQIKILKDLPELPVAVMADREKIKQVFTNLMSNAIKFTGNNGLVTMRARDNKHYVLAEVEDTGQGIPATEIPKLFNKFYQVESHMTRYQGGTGLGLAIVKEIINLHSGLLRVKSEVGKGTTIGFMLPKYKLKADVKPALCWEFNNCKKANCPAYKNKDIRCWSILGTLCKGEPSIDKIALCEHCEFYTRQLDEDTKNKSEHK